VIPFDTAGQMIAPMSAGQLDVGAGGITAGLFNAIGQGLPLRVVANKAYNPPGSDYVGWAVRQDLLAARAIQNPADLRGRVFGMGSAPSIVDLELDVLLRRGGLSLADVELKQVAYADQPPAFGNKSIDVAYQFEPTITRLRDGGLADLWIRSADLVPNQQSSIIMYAADFGSSRRTAADRWMVAYLRGVRDYERAMRQTPRDGAVVAILTKNTSVKDPELWQRMTPNAVNPNGYVDRDVVQQDLDFFVQNGWVEHTPDLSQVIDNSFVDYALGALGRQ
jgi:NitT/TauT family transport system substrate-binding protein